VLTFQLGGRVLHPANTRSISASTHQVVRNS